jgi:plastocyanin
VHDWRRIGSLITCAVLTAVVVGCSDDDGSGPDGSDALTIELAPDDSGDDQTGTIGGPLPNGLRVLLTEGSEPQSGVEVAWATPDGGGLAPATSTTNSDGIATTFWTLGPELGPQTATAAADGAEGSPVTFTATAEGIEPPPPPPPTPSATIQVLGPDGGNRFEPAQVTILAGQTVRWSWPQGSLQHNIVPDGGDEPAPSGAFANGPKQYDHTFNSPGTFAFYCSNHGGPGGVGMAGTVTVNPIP